MVIDTENHPETRSTHRNEEHPSDATTWTPRPHLRRLRWPPVGGQCRTDLAGSRALAAAPCIATGNDPHRKRALTDHISLPQ